MLMNIIKWYINENDRGFKNYTIYTEIEKLEKKK